MFSMKIFHQEVGCDSRIPIGPLSRERAPPEPLLPQLEAGMEAEAEDCVRTAGTLVQLGTWTQEAQTAADLPSLLV